LTWINELLDKDALGFMPTYEYECQKCGHHYELYQSIKDAPKRTCPRCRGRVKRLLGTGAGLIFKGSGFYTTDYRKPAYKEAAKKESGPSTTTASAPKSDAAKSSDTKASPKKD
jgi:putative FmdB family regulatory protein